MIFSVSCQNHASGSRNWLKKRRALRSAKFGAFEILMKKLRVEDTEAYKEMM